MCGTDTRNQGCVANIRTCWISVRYLPLLSAIFVSAVEATYSFMDMVLSEVILKTPRRSWTDILSEGV
jgi:hypothetical protein